MDFLKFAVASAISKSSNFPATIGDKVDVDPSIWTLNNGTKRVTKTRLLDCIYAEFPCRMMDQIAVSSLSTPAAINPAFLWQRMLSKSLERSGTQVLSKCLILSRYALILMGSIYEAEGVLNVDGNCYIYHHRTCRSIAMAYQTKKY